MARTAREFLSELDEEIRRDTAQRPVKHVVTADEILNRYNFETTFADKLKKVGFFGQDGSTQTDSSEIMPMNELADALRTLMDEFVTLKRDFTLTKGALLSGLDEKLRSKATELYCRINTKMEEMEQMHIDRVSVVRAAFRQQLADILAAIRSQFVDIVEEQLRLGRAKMQMIIDAKEDKIKELQAVVQRQASMIELLKKQLAETQKQLQAVLEELTSARMVEVHRTPPPVARDPTPVKPLTPPPPPPPLITEEELQALRNELARLQDELRELRSEMTKKSANADSLGRELNALKEALEKERAANQDLHGENDVLRAQLESSAENYRLLFNRSAAMAKSAARPLKSLEQQKLEFEKRLVAEVERARQEAFEKAMTEAAEMAAKARLQLEKLQEEKQRLEELIAKLRSDIAQRDGRILELFNSGKNERTLAEQISRLNKEIARLSAMWEKKFAVTKQRMNALKDEAYLRSQLQRQAAQLHQATVQYASDYLPVGIVAGGNSVDMPMRKSKDKLPDIAQQERVHKVRSRMSYSVSAASGKATTNDEDDRFSSEDEDVTKFIDSENFKPFNLERNKDDL